MARRGYAREHSASECGAAWQAAVGDAFGRFTRAGAVRRGVLEVIVGNSALMQELTFQKSVLLEKLNQSLPDENIKNLRFRVGVIE